MAVVDAKIGDDVDILPVPVQAYVIHNNMERVRCKRVEDNKFVLVAVMEIEDSMG